MEEIYLDYEKRKEISVGWELFLSEYRWNVFFTLTFRDPAGSGQCAIDRSVRLLKKCGKKLHQKSFTAFIVAESHLLGGYHVHGLLVVPALNDEHLRMLCTEMWEQGMLMYGRNRFEIVESAERVRLYVSKYILKSVADWTFLV